MIKKFKALIIISNIIMFLPMVFGLCVWDKLPNQMAVHWGIDGNPDSFASKGVAVFLYPLIPIVVHWLCIILSRFDHRHKEQSIKVVGLILLICPMLSVVINCITYLAAFNKPVDVSMLILLMIGILFTAIGNYMPKTLQNRYIGIRVKWTLESEDNWRATHRFAGKLWTFGGIALMGIAFLPDLIAFISTFVVLLVITAIPIIYSYRYSKKQSAE